MPPPPPGAGSRQSLLLPSAVRAAPFLRRRDLRRVGSASRGCKLGHCRRWQVRTGAARTISRSRRGSEAANPADSVDTRGTSSSPCLADPCDLGGSDLDTTPVSYAVSVIAGPDVGKLFRKIGPAPNPDTQRTIRVPRQCTRSRCVGQRRGHDRVRDHCRRSNIRRLDLDGDRVGGTDDRGRPGGRWVRVHRARRVRQGSAAASHSPRVCDPAGPTGAGQARGPRPRLSGNETTIAAAYPTVGLWTGYMDVTGGNSIIVPDAPEGVSRCDTRVGVQDRASRTLFGEMSTAMPTGCPGRRCARTPPRPELAHAPRHHRDDHNRSPHLALRVHERRLVRDLLVVPTTGFRPHPATAAQHRLRRSEPEPFGDLGLDRDPRPHRGASTSAVTTADHAPRVEDLLSTFSENPAPAVGRSRRP